MKKIIICNLIVLFSLFCILEFVSYLYIRYDAGDFLTEMKKRQKMEVTNHQHKDMPLLKYMINLITEIFIEKLWFQQIKIQKKEAFYFLVVLIHMVLI